MPATFSCSAFGIPSHPLAKIRTASSRVTSGRKTRAGLGNGRYGIPGTTSRIRLSSSDTVRSGSRIVPSPST